MDVIAKAKLFNAKLAMGEDRIKVVVVFDMLESISSALSQSIEIVFPYHHCYLISVPTQNASVQLSIFNGI